LINISVCRAEAAGQGLIFVHVSMPAALAGSEAFRNRAGQSRWLTLLEEMTV
jgi:hypothetical protein